MTKDQWAARVLWHLEQADSLLANTPPADAVTVAGRASAHSRTAAAICAALDAKVIK